MNMKTTITSIALLAPAAWLGAALPGGVDISSELTYASRYVFRGVQQAGNSFQPTLELAMDDLYAGVWGNFPTDAGQGRELNYYGGFTLPVAAIAPASLDLGLTVYHYPGSADNSTREFYLGAIAPTVWLPRLSGSVYYFYDVDLRSHVAEAALTYSQSLERWGLPAMIDYSVLGGLVGGRGIDGESYNYYGASVDLPFHFTDYATLTPGVHYASAERYTYGPGERGRNLFWSISYSAAF
jgi:uncharacterized protein (TIGR02001 family)